MSWHPRTIPASDLRVGDRIGAASVLAVVASRRGTYVEVATDDGDVTFTRWQEVTVLRERRAPAHVRAAAAAYRDARDAWERQAEAVAVGYATELAEFRAVNPPPRFPDFLRDACAKQRHGFMV